ncbi:MAG: fibronectin type III domain-containing protein, partial [Patescibacteria group bacterium]
NGGGGSGGGIYLEASTITHTGTIEAKGGIGGYGNGNWGGSGGGGMIALYAQSITAGTLSVAGGASPGGGVLAGSDGPTPIQSTPSYPTSGTQTYISAIIDSGQVSDFGIVSWNATTPANTSVSVSMRSCGDSTCSTNPSYTSLTSGNDTGSTFDGNRYFQYKATLATTAAASTPSLDDITFNYQYYPTGDTTLTSSPFNTEDAMIKYGSLTWDATLPTNTSVKFQIRVAQDSTGNPGTWTEWCGPSSCSGSNYFTTSGETISNTTLTSGSNAQWFEYKAILNTTDTSVTPTLNGSSSGNGSVKVSYSRALVASTLTSSIFNTQDAGNGIWKVKWIESGISAGGNVDLQIATSSDNVTFGQYFGPTSLTDYFDGCTNDSCTTFPTGWATNAQYFKYKIRITPNNDGTAPTVDDMQIFYKRILSGGTFELISSPYDAGSTANAIGSVALDVLLLPSGTSAKMQLRTASSQGNLSSASWCGPTNCTGSTFDTTGTGANPFGTLASALTDGSNDQWVQYKIILSPASDSLDAPYVTAASVTYVVNASPEFNSGTQSALEGTDGAVTISYSVRDSDTTTGLVTPTFLYSLDGWVTSYYISTANLTNYAPKAVQTSTYTPTTTTWSAEATVGSGVYEADAQIRIVVNDLEARNNYATSTTANFILDTTDPTGGTLYINGSNAAELTSTTVSVTISSALSDNSQVQIQLSDDNSNWYAANSNGTIGSLGAYGTATTTGVALGPWSFTLDEASRSKTLYARVKDVYGNIIGSNLSATATQNNAPSVSITNTPAIGDVTGTTPGVISTTFTVSDSDSSATPADTTATTTLMVDLGVTASTISTTNGTSVTASGTNNAAIAANDVIQIDNEFMLVSANSSGTLTVTRGYGGTTAATHTNGSTVWLMAKTPTGNVCTNTTFRAGTCTPVTNASGPFTATWTPMSDFAGYAHATAMVKVTAIDGRAVNQVGSGNSAALRFDTIRPVNASPAFTFDAGVAGSAGSATISINHPTDATSTQYFLAATTTDGTLLQSGWTTLSGAGPTSVSRGFDSAIGTKSVFMKFRDLYGNEQTATTTITTVQPVAGDTFLVQDVSKASLSDWRLYIAWEAATTTSFASYKLEYATSTDNTTFGSYADVTTITDKTTNYYVHTSLNNSWYYRYRIGVKDTAGNTTVRSNAYINAKPDGVQNLGEGGGGTSVSASVVTTIVPTQGSDGNVTVTYNLTDSALDAKTSPSYQAYLAYDLGVALTASSTTTLVLSDTTKMPSSGYIQINQEVIGYTGNATSTGTLSGITRGTWPTYVSSGRVTRVNTTMASSTPVWIIATSTGATITSPGTIDSANGQSGSITWTTSNDTNLAGYYLSTVGIRVLVHDGQSASSGPLSSQSDLSNDGVLTTFDKKVPTVGANSLLINGSSSSVEAIGSTVALTLTGITGDTSSETVYVQYATSTPSVWRGANADNTINMTPDSWGTAISLTDLTGKSWTWTLSGRSETVTVRVKDGTGNIASTDTNSIIKNAVPEFNGAQTDADASSYESKSNASVVIRQCNIYDTGSLCTAGKVKVKLQVRDPDAGESQLGTAGTVHTTFEASLNGGAYSTISSGITTYSDGSADAQMGTSTVSTTNATSAGSYSPAYTTVTTYYDPGIATGQTATLAIRVTVTDNEAGTTAVTATSNSITYDKAAPSGTITFDGGVAGTAASGTITVPVPTDATTTQYLLAATSTSDTLTYYGWTTLPSATTVSHGFSPVVEGKTVSYRFRDTYGNAMATTTTSSIAPPLSGSFSIQDISNASAGTWRTFLGWEASTSSSFSLYRLEGATSTDNSTYTSWADLITIPTVGTNYYLHTSSSNSVYFRYRVSTKDTSGNYSVKTNAYFTAKPDGTLNFDETAANDTTAPGVNTVTSASVKATTATVTFNSTDNASLVMSDAVYWAAQADYTTKVGQGSTERDRYVYKFGNPGYVTVGSIGATAAHSVALTGLTKNLQYRYAAETCDATGNCTFDDNSDAGYTFTMQNGPAIVSGSIVTTPSYDSASITWKTDLPADGIAFYATTSSSSLANPKSVGSNSQVTSADGNGHYVHTVTVPDLAVGTYYYKVRSTDQNSSSDSYTQYDESAILSFTTTVQSPATITAGPSCSTTDSTAIVSWTTDQETTTEISVLTSDVSANYFSTTPGAQYAQYPTGTINDASRASADYGTSHTNTFSGLSQTTTYYAKVRSLNRTGGEVSNTLTCVTTAKESIILRTPPAEEKDTTPPLISSIMVSDITATSATVKWQTDELADSLAKYGLTLTYGSIAGTEELSSSHAVVVSGLRPETPYNFKVTSADARGNRAYAGDQTFSTLSFEQAAQGTRSELEKLQDELQDLKEKQESEAKKALSLAEATKRFKEILKSVSSDVSLQDLEDITSDITDTIDDITQLVTPPNIIGGVPQVSVESSSATVVWRTNKQSNSIIALVDEVRYDAQSADPYVMQVGQPQEEVTAHSVTISNLYPSTVYHFQIRSQAKVGPEGKSRDFIFETKPEVPVIIDYSFKRI